MTTSDRLWRVLAVVLFVAGIVVNLVRPLAPAAGSTVVELEHFDTALLDAVASYRQPRLWAALAALLIVALVPLVLLAAPGIRRRLLSLADVRSAGAPGIGGDALRGALVAGVILLVVRVATLPIDVWLGHVQERAWSFRSAGLGDWFRDWSIGVGVEVVVVSLAGAAFVALVHRWPDQWHHRMVVAATVLAGILVLLQPLVVQPLLLTTSPLPDGPLHDRLEQVMQAAGVRADITVGDASRRTTKVNAFVTGLGPSRQVVLWDTLLERPQEEVVAVVAHELAHRQHRDLPRGVLLTATGVLPFVVVLRRTLRSGWAARRVVIRRPGDPRIVAVLLAGAALAQALAMPAALWVSRRAEAAADHRALSWTADPGPLVATFRGFVARDLAWRDPPALAVLLFGSHPSIDRRIRAVVTAAEQADLELPSLRAFEAREAGQRHPRSR